MTGKKSMEKKSRIWTENTSLVPNRYIQLLRSQESKDDIINKQLNDRRVLTRGNPLQVMNCQQIDDCKHAGERSKEEFL